MHMKLHKWKCGHQLHHKICTPRHKFLATRLFKLFRPSVKLNSGIDTSLVYGMSVMPRNTHKIQNKAISVIESNSTPLSRAPFASGMYIQEECCDKLII